MSSAELHHYTRGANTHVSHNQKSLTTRGRAVKGKSSMSGKGWGVGVRKRWTATHTLKSDVISSEISNLIQILSVSSYIFNAVGGLKGGGGAQ